MDERNLYAVAEQTAAVAHAPYSGLRIGCTLEASDGRVFQGCNVENASYGLTICAERAALVHAIALGAKRFRRLAVYSCGDRILAPCGACRQALSEFGQDLEILLACSTGETRRTTLKALLPDPFGSGSIPGGPAIPGRADGRSG
jgi:cytidine deaminase